MTERRLASVLALVTALLLSGCVAIPTSSGVQTGPVVGDAEAPEGEFASFGPEPGATQQEILQDFMLAGASAENDYRVARQFLTEEFSTAWNPNASVVVRSGGPAIGRTDDNTMTYRVNTRAGVDATGRYFQEEVASENERVVRFEQENGEWRIAEAPDGIVLTDAGFASAFDSHSLYFWEPDFEYLVPDLRWFPRSSQVQNRIVRELLAGPTEWLDPAVVQSFPNNTTIAAPVEVVQGEARVTLSEEAQLATTQQRVQLREQLRATLSTLPDIRSVTVLVNDVPLPIEDSDTPPLVQQPVDSRVLLLRDGEFGFTSPSSDEIDQIGQLSAKVVDLEPTSVTYAAGGGRAAAVRAGDGAVYLVLTGEAPPVQLDTRADLAPPAIDSEGMVWSAPEDSPSALVVYDQSGEEHPLASSLPASGRVASIDVSRDGARVAFYLETSGGAVLSLFSVVRDDDGVPESLVEAPPIPIDGARPIDATWVDGRSLATLGERDGATRVMQYDVGGQIRTLGGPSEAVSIVGGNGGVDGLRVLDGQGIVLQQRGSGWQSAGLRASLLATQQ